MRLLLDANIILDCLVLEADGQPRIGKLASEAVISHCDSGRHHGLIAWHTLPIVAYYHSRQNGSEVTSNMMDELLAFLEVPAVAHKDAAQWRKHGVEDFEDALQVACALAGGADFIISRNGEDFANAPIPAMTPEAFLTAHA